MPCREGGMIVGILGAGRMAQGFDAPGSARVLSLAHAVAASAAFELGGFFDVRAERAVAAEQKWGVAASPRERAAWLDHGWDVVCVATPEAEHARDVADMLARKPKGIVVEKPLALDSEEGARLLDRADALGIPLVVDFPRRWHSGVSTLARDVANGRLGAPLAAVFVYSGDAARAVSHMLDLFHSVWGDWEVATPVRASETAALALRRPGASVAASFVRLSARAPYVWELHVYCERGKVELSHSPEMLEVSSVGPHTDYPSFSVLTQHARYDMENEPLLARMLETLAEAIADPDAGRRLLRREQASHRFVGAALAALEVP
jgi:predicted dehydrogenase